MTDKKYVCLINNNSVTQLDTTNRVIIEIFVYVAFIYFCTRLPGQ